MVSFHKYGNDANIGLSLVKASCIGNVVEYISRVVGPDMSFCFVLLKKLYCERTLKLFEEKLDLHIAREGVGQKNPPTTKFPFDCVFLSTAIVPFIAGYLGSEIV